MKWIACDTSSRFLVLVAGENQKLKKGVLLKKPFEHTRDLIPELRKLLKNLKWKVSDVDCFAFGRGPGSYTGLRVGLSALKALSLSSPAKLALFSSLKAIGYNLPRKTGHGWVIVDARREKFYALSADLSSKEVRWTSHDQLLSRDQLKAKLARQKARIYVAGDAEGALQWQAEKPVTWSLGALNAPSVKGVFQAALEVINGGEFITQREVLPAYMRASEAEETRQKLEKKSRV
jgi:tRNA threonylcarbamoyladenosine biosynthesis protein TsaB